MTRLCNRCLLTGTAASCAESSFLTPAAVRDTSTTASAVLLQLYQSTIGVTLNRGLNVGPLYYPVFHSNTYVFLHMNVFYPCRTFKFCRLYWAETFIYQQSVQIDVFIVLLSFYNVLFCFKLSTRLSFRGNFAASLHRHEETRVFTVLHSALYGFGSFSEYKHTTI